MSRKPGDPLWGPRFPLLTRKCLGLDKRVETKTFSGTVDIGDPLTLTIGQVTGLLPDVARNVGKALPGERYRVTFEQIVEE